LASGSCKEKVAQRISGLIRNFFRKEMAGIERVTLDIITPGSPERKRPALLRIPVA
jgi:hypothetical protein